MDNTEKEKTIPQRYFTKCAEYAEFMKNPQNDDKTKKNNPVPKDGRSIEELEDFSDDKLLRFINEVAKTPNKSDRRVMFAKGLGFTWEELKVVAKFKGYKCWDELSNTPRFTISSHERKSVNKINNIDSRIMIEHGHRDNTVVKKLTLSTDTIDKINYLIGDSTSNQVTSKIIDAIISNVMDVYIRYKNDGIFEVRYKATEEKRII